MNVWAAIGLGVLVLLGAGALTGYGAYRRDSAAVDGAWAAVSATSVPAEPRFDPDQVAHLPEIAQRYLRHAIAPGTPLYSAAEIEMDGAFLLGNSRKYQAYRMSAVEALKPPCEFVWRPRLTSSLMTITGSDALVGGKAWTRFWMLGLVPVANDRTTPDLVRSAQFRVAVEGALWMPASLLPQNKVEWRQTGPDEAEVSFQHFTPVIVLRLTLDREGAVRKAVGERWSNVNPSRSFRLQPFGGTMSGDEIFQGLTIPTRMKVGNNYGTDQYLPFFQARITRATYR